MIAIYIVGETIH